MQEAKGDVLEKLSWTWQRLAVSDADERRAADLIGLWKVRFKQRWTENDRHLESYTIAQYTSASPAIVLKMELSR